VPSLALSASLNSDGYANIAAAATAASSPVMSLVNDLGGHDDAMNGYQCCAMHWSDMRGCAPVVQQLKLSAHLDRVCAHVNGILSKINASNTGGSMSTFHLACDGGFPSEPMAVFSVMQIAVITANYANGYVLVSSLCKAQGGESAGCL